MSASQKTEPETKEATESKQPPVGPQSNLPVHPAPAHMLTPRPQNQIKDLNCCISCCRYFLFAWIFFVIVCCLIAIYHYKDILMYAYIGALVLTIPTLIAAITMKPMLLLVTGILQFAYAIISTFAIIALIYSSEFVFEDSDHNFSLYMCMGCSILLRSMWTDGRELKQRQKDECSNDE